MFTILLPKNSFSLYNMPYIIFCINLFLLQVKKKWGMGVYYFKKERCSQVNMNSIIIGNFIVVIIVCYFYNDHTISLSRLQMENLRT